MTDHDPFPTRGEPADTLFARLTELTSDDVRADGRAFAFAYDAGPEVEEIARRAFAACMGGNGLDPTAYPSARRLENEVVAATIAHLRGDGDVVGTATAGGTESVLLAVKTARDHARRTRPEITAPQMLLPETAHASFHKAGWYFGVEVVPTAVDPDTMRADVADVAAKITPSTILIVGSAPSYAHGVVDPIPEMAALAQRHGALMHVDACIGGWVLPFQRELGVDVPDFDLTVPGVTSLSVDLHKYAFAPKGVSVLLQRRRELRDDQYYACASWSGYTIVNSTTLGSKSLAALGAAWAVLRHLGRDGYRELVRRTWEATGEVVRCVDEMRELRVVGRPAMGLIAIAARGDGDVFELADRLSARGWLVQPTYRFGASPAHVHLTMDPGNAARVDELLADLAECARDLPGYEASEPAPELVQMLEAVATGQGPIPPAQLMGQMGIADGRLPGAQAPIHRLVNELAPPAREALLSLFIGELFS